MLPTLAAFVFGFVAGYLMLRLATKKQLTSWERKVLRPLGWVMMGASFALALALLAWGLLESGRG